MKYIIYSILIFFSTAFSYAQTNTEYYLYLPKFEQNRSSLEKTYFKLAKDKIIVEFKSGFSVREKEDLLARYNLIGNMKNSKPDMKATLIARIDNENYKDKDIQELIISLNKESILNYASPFLISKDGMCQGVTNDIVIKLKKSTSKDQYLKVLREQNLIKPVPNKYYEDIFTVNLKKVNSSLSIIEVSNQLYETGIFEFVQPDFIRLIKFSTINDPLFSDEWYLNNVGQNNGDLGEDIEAEAGWSINNGGSINTKIAILDEGVQLNHPDLPLVVGTEMVVDNNIDYESSNFGGGPAPGNPHGTYCAGAIGAKADNNIGIAGIAHNSMIYSYRIAYKDPTNMEYWKTQDSWIANAVDDAVFSGVKVINMSFILGNTTSSVISNSFLNAVTQGNNLKGVFLVASTGNENSSTVEYPASDTNVFAVGASSMCGERVSPSSCDGENWGSNYGSTINVVAPGSAIITTNLNGLYTVVSGTSLSAPIVAGIAALLMDSKPSDHVNEIKEYIESTCEEVGGYFYPYVGPSHPTKGWNQEMGYGRVNLKRALEQATGQIATGTATPPPTPPAAHHCLTADFSYGTTVSIGNKVFSGYPSNYTYDSECYPWPSYNFVGITDLRWTLFKKNNNGNYVAVDNKHATNLSTSSAPNYTNTGDYFFNDYNFTTVGEEYMLQLEAWDATHVLDDNGNTINYTNLTPNDKDDYSFYDAISKTFVVADCNGFSIDASTSGIQTGTNSYQICDGDPLELNVQAIGGVAPYTYSWYRTVGNYPTLIGNINNTIIDETVYQQGNNNFKVIVRDAQNCQQIQTLSVDVKHIDIVSPSQILICRYDSGTIDITATGEGPLSYLWSQPYYNFLSAPTDEDAIIEIDPTLFGSSANFTVTVSDINGCQKTASTLVKATGPTSVAVNAGLDQSACAGGNVTLTAFPLSQNYTYQWMENTTSIAGTTDVINVNPTSTSTYTLIIRDENNCPSTDDVVVTIDPLLNPVVDLGGNVTICPGLPITITPTVANVTLPTIYTWSDNSTNTIFESSGFTDETISLSITDANGCTGMDAIDIVRDPNLSPTVILDWTNENTICPGESANIVTTVTGGSQPYGYLWSNNEITEDVAINTNGLHSLIVTDNNGCQTNKDVTVVIPSNWVTASEPVITICAGSVVNLSNHQQNGWQMVQGGTEPYQSYQWYPSANVANPTSEVTTATPTQTTFYSLIVQDSHGCTSSQNYDFIQQHHFKVISDTPHISLQYSESELCENRTICFNANVNWGVTEFNPNNPFVDLNRLQNNPWVNYPDVEATIMWNFGSAAIPQTSTEEAPCVEFLNEGNHTVNLTVTNICGSTTYTENIYVPDYNFTNSPYNNYICGTVPKFKFFPKPATFQSIFSAQNNIYASDCGNNVVAENSHVEYLAGNEIYLKPGFWANNTSFKAYITTCASSGFNRLMSDNTPQELPNIVYDIYPNPTSGIFNVEFSQDTENTTVEVLNLMGKVILSETVPTSKLTLDLSNEAKGIYLVKITTNGTTTIEKVVYQ